METSAPRRRFWYALLAVFGAFYLQTLLRMSYSPTDDWPVFRYSEQLPWNQLFTLPYKGSFFLKRLVSGGSVQSGHIVAFVTSLASLVLLAQAWRQLEKKERALVLLCLAAIVGNSLICFFYTRDRMLAPSAFACAVMFAVALKAWVRKRSPASVRAGLALVSLIFFGWICRCGTTYLRILRQSEEIALGIRQAGEQYPSAPFTLQLPGATLPRFVIRFVSDEGF